MLALERKAHESILIGSDVRVVVTWIRGDTVRLGIEAPPHVPIHREEVAQRIAAGEGPRPRPLPNVKLDPDDPGPRFSGEQIRWLERRGFRLEVS